jgi:hypothetical protein
MPESRKQRSWFPVTINPQTRSSDDFAVFCSQVDTRSCWPWRRHVLHAELVIFINTADPCLQLPKRKDSRLSYSEYSCRGSGMHVGTARADAGPWFELCKGATPARFEAECFHYMIATYFTGIYSSHLDHLQIINQELVTCRILFDDVKRLAESTPGRDFAVKIRTFAVNQTMS